MTHGFLDSPALPQFVYWIRERERIRLLREMGAKPLWSTDQIFNSVRFCNIRREDDKVTRWIKKNWRDPYANHKNLSFGMLMARVINLPECLEALGFPEKWDPVKFERAMDDRAATGLRLWTGAYMVTGGYSKGGETKQKIIARVLDDGYKYCSTIRSHYTLERAHNEILCTNGIGTFLAAQAIADIKYTSLLAGAADWHTFCAPGPGALKGLNILHGRPAKSAHVDFSEEVNEIRLWLAATQGIVLTAHDVQNCLCEFSKYMRVKEGGRAKTSFDPSRSFKLDGILRE